MTNTNDLNKDTLDNSEAEKLKSNKEYLDVLNRIKEKVESESNTSVKEDTNDNFEDTVILSKDEIKSEGSTNNFQKLEETLVMPLPELENNNGNQDNYYKDVVLEVLGLKKRIGLKTIVEDISFDMKKGEIIGLLGPNGSGKTTIMRMMVGLTKATKGDIYCFETPLGLGRNKMMSEVGAMIESPEFYNYMSGYSNLKQLARLSGKKITRSKIKETLKFVGLEKVARKKVKTYSLGMRQRLGLAQALIHDPKILILDEPVNGLDPQGVQDFRNKLKEIAANGVSILISSHLLDEIEKVSDRIIVLEKGRIIFDDTLDNLRGEEVTRTLINTYDNDRSEELLKYLEFDYVRLDDGFIFENISKEEKSKIVSYLVTNYVEIDTIKIITKTLEERFLEITGKGGEK
ncbi:ABC transporter ATP-binding protein [Gemelliphila palaticanis]|uniref:ABC transporter ATP-binding protein n=1 Tax=Gemelliphila palaticanis TaxID=81950 RepID=A0ABX2SZC5_9BACL|nr:ABC transporter ATP-binding protein [Gemella palaticanis]MBF0715791.1 ABC transporter ATP-binding protein [Gemella palaticanis]NYS47721.1 ABC transporter ATP-binding protein [Gemella palaticanis]